MVHMVAVSESARGLPVAPRGGEEWTTEMLGLLPDDGLRYELTASAEGDEPVTVAAPLSVTVAPTALVSS